MNMALIKQNYWYELAKIRLENANNEIGVITFMDGISDINKIRLRNIHFEIKQMLEDSL